MLSTIDFLFSFFSVKTTRFNYAHDKEASIIKVEFRLIYVCWGTFAIKITIYYRRLLSMSSYPLLNLPRALTNDVISLNYETK